MAKSKKEEISFNENLESLHEIVEKLRSGDLELEESLEVYSQGVKTLAELKKQLKKSECKITKLMGEIDGSQDEEYSEISHA